jgi:putative membrane protein insertion efficiency factor
MSVRQAFRKVVRNPAKALFVGAIRFYQVIISPGLAGRCKYYPSCSQYALDAVREYGAARGFVLAAWRVMRCNPMSYGGYDPVSRQRVFRARGDEADSVGEGAATDGDVCRHGHSSDHRRWAKRHPVQG